MLQMQNDMEIIYALALDGVGPHDKVFVDGTRQAVTTGEFVKFQGGTYMRVLYPPDYKTYYYVTPDRVSITLFVSNHDMEEIIRKTLARHGPALRVLKGM